MLDGLPDALGDRGLRNGQPDQPAAGIADFKAALAAGAEQAAERLRQLAQLGQRVLQIGVLVTRTSTLSPRGGKAGIADPGFAQRAAHVVAHLVELLLLDVVGIDLEQQVRAALQIEAEHQPALRPCRPGLDGRFGKEIRNGAKAHHQRRQDDRQRLPPREIQHRVDPSDPGECGAARSS